MITHLEDLFLAAADDYMMENHKDTSDVMPLHDKILLWINMQGAKVPLVPGEGDAFEGVGDDVDGPMTETEHAELQQYLDAIYQSFAYKWFIGTILKQNLLRVPEPFQGLYPHDTLSSNIYETVLRQFSPGKISKRRPPPLHRATFRIRRNWDQYQSMHQQALRQVHQTVVATGCDGEMQMTTVAEYIRQTWPLGGEQFANSFLTGVYKFAPCSSSSATATLQSLGRLGLEPSEVFVDILPDKTRLAVGMDCGNVFVTVDGTSYSIAECGEQLGWLSAILFGQPAESTATDHCCYACPEVIALNNVSLPDILWLYDSGISGGLHPQGHGSLKALDINFTTRTAKPRWEQQLLVLLPYGPPSVVVEGYPVARRPDPISALEISSRALLRKPDRVKALLAQKRVELELPGTKLLLVRTKESTFYWHLATAATDTCPFLSLPVEGDSGFGDAIVPDHSKLWNGRHMLCACRAFDPHRHTGNETEGIFTCS